VACVVVLSGRRCLAVRMVATTFSMTEIAVKTKVGCCRDWALLVFYRMALMVLGTKSVGDLEIAFTRGRRVVHRTQIQVGESAGYTPLLFWEEARRGFLSVRGERETIE